MPSRSSDQAFTRYATVPRPFTDLREPSARYTDFQRLMRKRVNNILLVSSLYDSFILAQDGQIEELLLSEFMELNLYNAPSLTRVPRGGKALKLAASDPTIDLVIATANLGDMTTQEFARQLKAERPNLPLVLLTYDNREINRLMRTGDENLFDRLFLWQGDFRILLAIVKIVEDRMNASVDTRGMGVQTILVVEDNIRFYSSYLPMIYGELMSQSQSLLGEGLNLANKILRMRARPKILLCTTYEDAWETYLTYEKYMLGVITDVEYKHNGVKDPEAGMQLVHAIRERSIDLPIVMQSFQDKMAAAARALGVDFVRKHSSTLLHDLRRVMKHSFSFGDFVFRDEQGDEIGRATDMKSLERMLGEIPVSSLLSHARRDHFSSWLKARTEFAVAARYKAIRADKYDNPEDLRRDLISVLNAYRMERFRGLIADFHPEYFDPRSSFARLGGGSLGGKARGLAFLAHLLERQGLHDRYEGVHTSVPATVVIATDVFDQFLRDNSLADFALNTHDEIDLAHRFQEADFPSAITQRLRQLLELMDYPIAVRSSGLLEDSLFQPFAGIYSTYMLPNDHPDLNTRLGELIRTIKMIYASTFSKRSRAYFRSTPYRLEEEKMAVIVQRLVGMPHGDRFYPDFAGVARSHNFYPSPPASYEDGIANVALGLGSYVMEGGEGVRFCPKFPQHIPQFATLDDQLNYSQKRFYALRLHPDSDGQGFHELDLDEYNLSTALEDGTLSAVGSVYSQQNKAIYDGVGRIGSPLVTFAPILKHQLFPLADMIQSFLHVAQRGVSRPVELEFAVNYSTGREPKEFVLLQMRPLVMSQEQELIDVGGIDESDMICRSSKVLGQGRLDDIQDVVYVDPHDFNRARTREAAGEVGRLNGLLQEANRSYLLIGLGRWGSTDPWLGIPVSWEQISGARVIVESDFEDITVQPSEGAHFFHNITSLGVGYFTINEGDTSSRIDWDWLRDRSDNEELTEPSALVHHIRLPKPLTVLMDGHTQTGTVLKPGTRPERSSRDRSDSSGSSGEFAS